MEVFFNYSFMLSWCHVQTIFLASNLKHRETKKDFFSYLKNETQWRSKSSTRNFLKSFCTDLIYFYLSIYFPAVFGPPKQLSTCQSLNWEKKVTLFWWDTPPSEVNVVSLYQRNVPASKEQFKVWTWKIWAVQEQPLFSVTAPLYCLRPPCIPPLLPPKVAPPRIRLWMKGFDWAVSQLANCRKGSPVNVC